MQRSSWRLPLISTRNQLSSVSSCCAWQACCGACVEPPRSKLGCSRRRRGGCCNVGGARQARETTIGTVCRDAMAPDDGARLQTPANDDGDISTCIAASDGTADDLTRSFVGLSNLPTYPLDRLSRYEATLWRQACQILFALQFLDRRKPWQRMRARIR